MDKIKNLQRDAKSFQESNKELVDQVCQKSSLHNYL